MVPTTAELLAELIRHRRHLGVSALPKFGDGIPLVPSIIGPQQPLARSAIHEIVKSIMRSTAERLRAQGPDISMPRRRPSNRHRRSHLSERADLKVVRDNLGHSNLSTTSIYLHTEDDARHDATEQAHRVGWQAP